MQTDGRLIQHVQHARGAVSHGTGQLHPLPLSRWTGWTPLDPVTGNQVPDPEAALPRPAKESQMLSAMGRISSGSVCGTPATHSTRSERVIWHTSARPSPRTFGSRARADRRVPPQSGQTPFLQKTLHPLHTLLILHLCQGIFHRIGGVVIGKIHLSGLIGRLGFVKNMLLFRGAVDTRYPALLAVSSRKGTSVRTPIARHTSVISDHIRVLQGATAPSSMVSESSGTSVASSTVRTMPVPPHVRQAPCAVKRQLFRRRRIKMYPAHRAHQIRVPPPRAGTAPDSGPLGQPMAATARENNQPQTVQKLRIPCQRYCGCPAPPAADAGPARPGRTAPHPPGPSPPGSSADACR